MIRLKIFYERKKIIEVVNIIMIFLCLCIIVSEFLINNTLLDFYIIGAFLFMLVLISKFFKHRKDRKLGKEVEDIIECKRFEVVE